MDRVKELKKMLHFSILSDKEMEFVRILIIIARQGTRGRDGDLPELISPLGELPTQEEIRRFSPCQYKELSLYLDSMSGLVSRNICNDLPEFARKLFSKEEWTKLMKDFHDYNGDPEEFTGEYEPSLLMDWIWMSYFSYKIKKSLN